uniref:Src homology 2 domain containing F n=1 Tax=Cairina moschata TaxID=8855 RepID=A0A8C3BEP6_CAIMO
AASPSGFGDGSLRVSGLRASRAGAAWGRPAPRLRAQGAAGAAGGKLGEPSEPVPPAGSRGGAGGSGAGPGRAPRRAVPGAGGAGRAPGEAGRERGEAGAGRRGRYGGDPGTQLGAPLGAAGAAAPAGGTGRLPRPPPPLFPPARPGLREHLGFRSAKPAPPAPPKPDYRAGPPQPPPPPGGAAEPLAAAQPDIVAAYRLQKERDFEDPYSGAPPSAAPDGPRYVSPKHRLIKVEAAEKAPAGPAPPPAAPGSPPAGPEPPDEPPQELAVLEDYADPFDAAQVAGSQAGLEKVTENDGYMEPYEAQKMMAEIRQKGLREAPSRPLHLYDTPYEPVAGGLEADSDRPACPRPRESRLPEDDERPPEEYDQPWEWKKERISKAFAVEIKVIKDLPWPPPVGQLDSGETPPDGEAGAPGPPQHGQQNYEDANGPPEGLGYGRTSPCREEKARAGLRHGTSSLKSTKTLSAEPGPFLGERIDPALPLESQCWYHGAISRTDAETLLRLCKEASYLVRNSETSKNDFSLSLKSSQGFMHMKLSRTQENKYVLGQHSPPFDSVPEIIHHYASRKLPIKGAEHMSLLYPVAIRTL